MEDLHAALKDLQSSLQNLLKKYNNLKADNEQLSNANAALKKNLSEKENLIYSSEEKMAANNLGTIYSEEEKELLQAKINLYLKDIEKCLNLLNA